MKYIAICIALYDYQSQNDEEISFNADDILYILDKEDPDWYKAQLKTPTEAADANGPIGLIPANYVENAKSIGRVKALYDYAFQSAEELSFKEDEDLTLYEKDDPDWFVVENSKGEIGLAPSNYVEEQADNKPLSKNSVENNNSGKSANTTATTTTTTTTPQPSVSLSAQSEAQPNCEAKWAIALFSFQPESQEETYLEDNEQVLITDYVSSKDWWTIEHKDGKTGIVPASYVKFQDEYEADLLKEEVLEKKRKAEAEAQASNEKQRQENERLERSRQRDLDERNRMRDQEDKEKARQLEVERRTKMQDEAKQREIEAKKQASIVAVAIASPQLGGGSPRRSEIPAPLPPKNTLSNYPSSSSQYSSPPGHNDPNRPDPSKVRMWTDRTGSFKVEAQFLTCANGKIRLFKTNGVKIDVPTQKMCVEDLQYIEKETGLRLLDDKTDNIPLGQLNNSRFTWLGYFKSANLPHNACIRYAKSFENGGLGEQDVERLTHRKMKSMGMAERHVQRIQRFIESNRAEPPSDDESATARPKLKTKKSVTFGTVSYIEENDNDDYEYEEGSVEWQIEQDERLARELQEQEQAHTPVAGGSGLGLHRRGTGRPTPTNSAPKGVNSAVLTPQQFKSEPLNPTPASKYTPPPPPQQQPLQPSPASASKPVNIVPISPKPAFEDEAWAPRAGASPSMQPANTTPTWNNNQRSISTPPTTISSVPPPMPPRQRPKPPASQQSLVDPQLLAKWSGSPALATANSRPVPPPPPPSTVNNNINALQALQQQQQAMFYQQQSQLPTGNNSFTSLQQQPMGTGISNNFTSPPPPQQQLATGFGNFTSLQGNNSFTTLQQQPTGFTPPQPQQQQQSLFNNSPSIQPNNQQYMRSPTSMQQNQSLSVPLQSVLPPALSPQMQNINTPQMTGSVAGRNWAAATPDNPFGGASSSTVPVPIYNSTGGTFQQIQQQFNNLSQQNTGFIPQAQQQQQYNTATIIDPLDKYSVFKTVDTTAPSVFNSNNNTNQQQQQRNFYY